MGTKILRWLFFTVLLSLVPILASYILGHSSNNNAVSLLFVLNQGDLYLLCSAFCAAGIGELVGLGKKRFEKVKIFVGGVAIIHVVFCIFLYVSIRNPSKSTDIDYLVSLSMILFATGVIASTACVALSEVGDA